MQQENIHEFLERFFTQCQCDIVDQSDYHLSVQLTVDLDKRLMNRPFYWHYLEKMGRTPEPLLVTFVTDAEKVSEDIKGELIYFGSPRLHQIFNAIKEYGSFVKVYEQTPSKTGLIPWLGVNFKLSYQCDRKKDISLSLGVNLLNGDIQENFHEKIASRSLLPSIPNYCFTLQSSIRPDEAMKELEKEVEKFVQEDDHTWAKKAEKRWKEDYELLEKFYKDVEEKPDSYQIEKDALQQQYQPKIEVNVLNGGLFYLQAI